MSLLLQTLRGKESVDRICEHTYLANLLGIDSTVLDLGANKGQFCRGMISRCGCRVFYALQRIWTISWNSRTAAAKRNDDGTELKVPQRARTTPALEERVQSGSPLIMGKWLPALLIGALFLLPYLVQIAMIGSYVEYSPFSARSPSPMVWDETFLYGAEANYMLTRGGAPAYDDTWEHRKAVYPYSILPIAVEAVTAKAVGGLKTAHLLLKFIFPALTALSFVALYMKCGADSLLATLLALLTLVLAFSPRTLLLADRAFLLHAHGARAFDTLEAARTPNPNLTFVLLLAAMICLAAAIRLRNTQKASMAWATAAGVLGGLLFYSYVYYAISWCGAVGLLSVLAMLMQRTMSRVVWLTLFVSGVFGIPFAIWKHFADIEGSYLARTSRLGLIHGHAVHAGELTLTLLWGALTLVCALTWWRLRHLESARESEQAPNYVDALMPVLLAVMLGGLVGLNMQLVTGFNVQAAHHLPHMVLQPVGLILIFALAALAARSRPQRRVVVFVMLVLAFAACAIAQIESARDSVEMFHLTSTERGLFDWLNANSTTGAVVATDDLGLSILLPCSTHDSVLFANGSRSTASDQELMERFLLASRLSGASPELVAVELNSDTAERVGVSSYAYYLFETSPYKDDVGQHIVPGQIPGLLHWFRSMNLEDELRRFRVDYLWTENGRVPAEVNNWYWTPVFTSHEGQLWHLLRKSKE
jgi:hypothetical protein